jgi:radical SAM superfamily enzyme with C-terminal helix-hairpin-helix motif
MVTDHGFRSVTGMEYPFPINRASMAAISSLPGIGKKRAAGIMVSRPVRCRDDLVKAVGDASVADRLVDMITFE